MGNRNSAAAPWCNSALYWLKAKGHAGGPKSAGPKDKKSDCCSTWMGLKGDMAQIAQPADVECRNDLITCVSVRQLQILTWSTLSYVL